MERLCPGPSRVGNPPPAGVKAISPRNIEVVCVKPPSGVLATEIAGTVPRIPAVPTGDSILKLDFLSNFFTSTTKSPNSMSNTVFELLGSPFRSLNLVLLVSNFSCVNFLKLSEVSGLTVVIVPFVSRRMILEEGPVLIVCPSKRTPPATTFSGGNAICVVLLTTVTCPSNPAIIIAPFVSVNSSSFPCCPKTKSEGNKIRKK